MAFITQTLRWTKNKPQPHQQDKLADNTHSLRNFSVSSCKSSNSPISRHYSNLWFYSSPFAKRGVQMCSFPCFLNIVCLGFLLLVRVQHRQFRILGIPQLFRAASSFLEICLGRILRFPVNGLSDASVSNTMFPIPFPSL